MTQKCEPKYLNLNYIQSFGEQRYVTVQLLQQICMNEEWLKQNVEKLKYLSPPAVRKGMTIVDVMDALNSYGCRENGHNQISFDNKTSDVITIDFDEHFDRVNQAKSQELRFINYTPEYDDDGNVINNIVDQYSVCEVPTKVETRVIEPEYESFGTTKGGGVNSFWYMGWDKSKPYYIRPDWLKNWRDPEIPAVCRAQTFKAEASGVLTSVDLKLDWNGSKGTDCGSPLYIQIWNTYKRFVQKTEWDRKKQKMVNVFIKFANLPKKANATAAQIKKGQYQEHYANYQRYEKYQKKLVYQEGKHKGEYKKDKKGNILTEDAYRKKDNAEYVIKREYVQWLGHNKKKGVDKNNKPVYSPNIYHPLAQAVYEEVGDPFPNIAFDKPCTVKEGQTYAIVLFSPLSEWSHCPRWGGWGRNCKRDQVYPNGHAFMSEDNGRTWKMYGKNGIDVDPGNKPLDYKVGKFTPQDFAFQCHVQIPDDTAPAEEVYSTDEYYLYSNPIYSNPITSVILEPHDKGSQSSETELTIDYEISTDNEKWIPIEASQKIYLDSPSTVLLLRAKLQTSNPAISPYIEHITLYLDCNPATEMYLRTEFYTPSTEPMLDASLWGRVFAPFTVEEKVNCSCEIIQGKPVTTHFKIIDIDELEDTFNSLDMDTGEISGLTDLNKAIYLTENFSILDTLKEKGVYIKPYENGTSELYLLSFSSSYNAADMVIGKSDETSDYYDDYNVGGLTFPNQVAHPILKARMQPPENDDESSEDVYMQWVDYTFDYDNNMLIFKKDRLDNLIPGDFYVTYNPIFIDGLSPEEVGVHIDSETGLSTEGLIFDYFKETFAITQNEIDTRKIKLRVKPLDPIREVKIIDEDTGIETELIEGIDYNLDINTNELVFKVNNIDGVSSALVLNKILQVVYTPNLTDISLALGYYATREDTSKQVYIDDAFFEYKV